MFLNCILIFLGVMTILLGIFNLITGAYIWGTLFILGGCWSIGIGIFYIVQDEKEKKKLKDQQKLEEAVPTPIKHPVDEGLLTQDLFEIDELTLQMFNYGNTEKEYTEPSDQTIQEDELITNETVEVDQTIAEQSDASKSYSDIPMDTITQDDSSDIL